MTKVLKVDPTKIKFNKLEPEILDSETAANLDFAAQTIKNGEVVAFPTETVYGLGANCLNTGAVSKIYTAKNRPSDNPLIIHVANKLQISTLLNTEIPQIYHNLINNFWPGPLTILLPLKPNSKISELCTKGQQTFGCRVPNHSVARALITKCELPLAAPSANASTKPSCTEAKHVFEDMQGKIELILDGGPADVGVESTVVDGLVTPPRILRPGGISIEQIRQFAGWENVVGEGDKTLPPDAVVKAPGMKYKHYSPQARVFVINKDTDITKLKTKIEGFTKVAVLTTEHLDFESFKNMLNVNTELISLPLGKTKREISHNLFSQFREADLRNCDCILVEAVDLKDEGRAIMNRLNKAAEEYLD